MPKVVKRKIGGHVLMFILNLHVTYLASSEIWCAQTVKQLVKLRFVCQKRAAKKTDHFGDKMIKRGSYNYSTLPYQCYMFKYV